MDPSLKTRVEVETLYELLPELDYYQLLRIPPETPQTRIESAFRRESHRLHPDRYNRLGDRELLDKVNAIYRRLNEAYRILHDPDARARYDLERARGAKRLSSEARESASRDAMAQSPEHAARTSKGAKYWRMAMKCWEDEDYKGAAINIQLALTFEPDNQVFKAWLEKARAAQDKDQEQKHMYKLRLV